jgi:hypothetical protein
MANAVKKTFLIPDFAVQNPPRSESEGLRGQTRQEFGQLCRVTQILHRHNIVHTQNPGLPRKADKSLSDLSHDPCGANFVIAKFGLIIAFKNLHSVV